MEAEVTCPRCSGGGEVTSEILASFREAGVEVTVQRAGECRYCGGSGEVAAVITEWVSIYDWTEAVDHPPVTDEGAFGATVARLLEAPPSPDRGSAWASVAWGGVEAGVSHETLLDLWERGLPFMDSGGLGRTLSALVTAGAMSCEQAFELAVDTDHPRAEGTPALNTWTVSYFVRFLAGRVSSERAGELLTEAISARISMPNPWIEAFVLARAAQVVATADTSLFMSRRQELLDVVMELDEKCRLGSSWRYPRHRLLQGYCEWTMPSLDTGDWTTLASEIMDLTDGWDADDIGARDRDILKHLTTQETTEESMGVFRRIMERLKGGASSWDWGSHAANLMNGLTGPHTSEVHVRELFAVAAGFGADTVWEFSAEEAVGMLVRHGEEPWAESMFNELISSHLQQISSQTTRGECIAKAMQGLGKGTGVPWTFSAVSRMVDVYGEYYQAGETSFSDNDGIEGLIRFWAHESFEELFTRWRGFTINETQNSLGWVWKLVSGNKGAFGKGYEDLFPRLFDAVLDQVRTFGDGARSQVMKDLSQVPYALPPGPLFERYTKALWELVDTLPGEGGLKAKGIEEMCSSVIGGKAYGINPLDVGRMTEGTRRLPQCAPDEEKLSCCHEMLGALNVHEHHEYAETIDIPVSISILMDLLAELVSLSDAQTMWVDGRSTQAFAVGCLKGLKSTLASMEPEDYTRYRVAFEGLLAQEVHCSASGHEVEEGQLPLVSVRPQTVMLSYLMGHLGNTGDAAFRDQQLAEHLAFMDAQVEREDRLMLIGALASSLGRAKEHQWADQWLDRLLELEVQQEADTSALRAAITLAYLERGETDRAEVCVRHISDVVRRDECLKTMVKGLATGEPTRAVRLASRLTQPTERLHTLEELGTSPELTLTSEVYGLLCGALVDTPNRMATVVEHCVERMPELVDVAPAEAPRQEGSTRDEQWREAIEAVAPELLEQITRRLPQEAP